MWHLLGHYALCHVFPWWLTLRPSKWVTLRVRAATGWSFWPVIVPFSTILFTFHTSSSHLLTFWVFRVYWPKKGLSLTSWEEGVEGLWLEKIKSWLWTFQMISQRGLERNEKLLLKNQRPGKEKSHYINVPTCWGVHTHAMSLSFLAYGTMCTSSFKWPCRTAPQANWFTNREYPRFWIIN
jgi:hypothetical protein